MEDPQVASKCLVEHALSRFSTDNLSCMVVRFDSKAVQQAVAKEVPPIGVEGDAAGKMGGISEAEAIVAESKKKLDESGERLDRIPSDLARDVETHDRELQSGFNVEAVEGAKVENKGKPSPPSESHVAPS